MEEFASDQVDLYFGGENADLLRQELLEMDNDFSTPHSTPLKCQARDDSDSESSNSDSDEDVIDLTVNADIYVDTRPLNHKEDQKVDSFVFKTCGCAMETEMDACSKQFSREQIAWYRNNCLQMTRSELNLVILAAIMCSRTHTGENGRSAKIRTVYIYQGVQICMKTFLFLHSISRCRLCNLQSHYDKHGVTPRSNSNTHHAPKHSASIDYVHYKSSQIYHKHGCHSCTPSTGIKPNQQR